MAFRRSSLVSFLVLALAVLAGLVGCSGSSSDPPPADAQDLSVPHLWLATPEVTPSGGLLAAVLVVPESETEDAEFDDESDLIVPLDQPVEDDLTFDLGAVLQRWNGSEWKDADEGQLCAFQVQPGCELGRDAEATGVNFLGDEQGTGPFWILAGELDAGSYRLGMTGSGETAWGRFEVTDDAPALPEADTGADLWLAPVPVVAPPLDDGATTTLTGFLTDGTDPPDLDGMEGSVERWDGESWVEAGAEIEVVDDADLPDGRGLQIVLGDGEIGAYRAEVVSPSGSVAVARFWVGEPS